MPRHCENAQKVAEFLQGHEKVAWVDYAGCPATSTMSGPRSTCPTAPAASSPSASRGRAAAERFMAGLKLAMIATHVADAHTCVLHPASSTHRQMTDAELEAAGVAPDMVRFSVGIENVDDIIADINQALENA